MSRSIAIPVEPSVLRWARETIGISPTAAAQRLKVDVEELIDWETKGSSLRVSILEKLSTLYKRPLVVFFLPEPPKERSIPPDFRSLDGVAEADLSPKLRLAIRRAESKLLLASDLEFRADKRVYSLHRDDPKEVANQVASLIQLDYQQVFDLSSVLKAFHRYRKSIEDLGVLVFQERFPVSDARAFSLVENGSAAIVLSGADSLSARIFSLFHELAHVISRSPGICSPQPTTSTGIEFYCNEVAGNVLVPAPLLIQQTESTDDESISRLARRFKVSREVILLRMLRVGLVDTRFFDRKRTQWRNEPLPQRKKAEVKIPAPVLALAMNGPTFSRLVIDAARQQRITTADASEALGVKVPNLRKLEQLANRY